MVLLGMAREERKFTPHLTLGRIKYIRSRDGWTKTLEEVKDISLPGFEATSVSLMKSELRASGRGVYGDGKSGAAINDRPGMADERSMCPSS